MAGETLIIALLFGDWHSFHFLLPSDFLIFSYVSLATTLLPMLIMVIMRRYVDGITLTFIALLEPIIDACFAFFFVHEHFLLQVYLGGILVIASMVLQACTGISSFQSFSTRGRHRRWRIFPLFRQKTAPQKDDFEERLREMQDMPLGRRACQLLVHLWGKPDGVDLFTLHHLTGIPCGYAHQLLTFLQQQGYVVSSHKTHKVSRYRLASSWDR